MRITPTLRILLLAASLAAVGTVFAGCGGEPANDPLMEEPPPAEEPANGFGEPGL